MKNTWVQDAKKLDAERLVIKKNSGEGLIASQPNGSWYVIGECRSGKSDEAGIYFEDPTG